MSPVEIKDFAKSTLILVIFLLIASGLGYAVYNILREKPLDVPPPFEAEMKDADIQFIDEEENAQVFLNKCTATPDTKEAEEMLSRANAYRAQNGLTPLKLSPTLMKAAAWFADDLLANNARGHIDSLGRDPSKRAVDCGYPTQSVAENIAGGSYVDPLPYWQQSPGHNKNLLKPNHTVMGYGIAGMGGEYRYVYITGIQDDTVGQPTDPVDLENECTISGAPINVDSSMCSSGLCQPYACSSGGNKYLCTGEAFRICNPQATPSPTRKAAPTGPMPSPSPTNPTSPSLSPTRIQVGTRLEATFVFPGIGAGGNSSIVDSVKKITMSLYDSGNKKVKEETITAGFSNGRYSGVFLLNDITPGRYYVRAKAINSLKDDGEPEIISVTQNAATQVAFEFVPGDLNSDNILDIRDYNSFITYFVGCLIFPSCAERERVDFNSDGQVDGIDYNILLRSFKEVRGS